MARRSLLITLSPPPAADVSLSDRHVPEDTAGPGRKKTYAFVLGWPLAEIGGVNQVIRNLILQISNSGDYDPLLIESVADDAPELSEPGFPVFRLAFPSPWDPANPLRALLRFAFSAPGALLRLYLLCRRFNVRTLNPHFIGLEYLSLALLSRSGLYRGKLILSFHGSDIRRLLQSSTWEKRLARFLLRSADYLVACSEGLREEILMLVPDCLKQVVVTHNGVDCGEFLLTTSPVSCLPKEFAGRKYLMNIGAFEYKKGHDVLLRAFASVREEYPDLGLVIVGQSVRVPTHIEALIVQLGLVPHVLLLKDLPRPAVAALLQSCELFVLSSRWEKGKSGEGFAMALLEAGAAGKPVVSTLSCGVRELIVDGESGALVPPDDERALANAICAMLADPVEAKRRARNLNDLVRHQFTWEKAYERYRCLIC